MAAALKTATRSIPDEGSTNVRVASPRLAQSLHPYLSNAVSPVHCSSVLGGGHVKGILTHSENSGATHPLHLPPTWMTSAPSAPLPPSSSFLPTFG